jgi:hypothetical protein
LHVQFAFQSLSRVLWVRVQNWQRMELDAARHTLRSDRLNPGSYSARTLARFFAEMPGTPGLKFVITLHSQQRTATLTVWALVTWGSR